MRMPNSISNLPVLAKVSALLVFIALFSTGFGLTLRTKNAAIKHAVVEQGETLDQLRSARNAAKAFGDMKYWNAELANSLQDSSIDAAAAAKALLFGELEALQVHNPELSQTVRTNADEIEELSLSAMDEFIMDERKAGNAYMAQAREKVGEVDQMLGALTTDLAARAEAARQSALGASQTALALSIPAMLGVLAALAIAGAALFSLVVTPIRRMTYAMLKLADGDATIALPAEGQKDEIGNMAGAVAVFRENMIEAERLRKEQLKVEERARVEKRGTMNQLADDFEASVTEMVDTVASSAGQMQVSAHELADTARSSGKEANGAAKSSRESADNIEMVAAATEELRSSIKEVTEQISTSAEFAHSAADAARESNMVVKSLGEAAARIDSIVQIIQDIAEQTNLLALNATIEAARAGDAGRGFSVVASEVKGLAEQTTKATQDISDQIKDIQDVAKISVEQIGEVAKSIGHIEERLANVSSAAKEQSATTGEISESIRRAAEHSKLISQSVTQLADASSTTESTSVQTHEATVEMTLQTERLGAEVREFLARVRSA
ncbi:MAG: methyl-accepting chemotaxis protein [Robiginitomaculum sp.]|nr:MAG: methyl-accepting chemotaxis protein [Robiginitomaculum sp.]